MVEKQKMEESKGEIPSQQKGHNKTTVNKDQQKYNMQSLLRDEESNKSSTKNLNQPQSQPQPALNHQKTFSGHSTSNSDLQNNSNQNNPKPSTSNPSNPNPTSQSNPNPQSTSDANQNKNKDGAVSIKFDESGNVKDVKVDMDAETAFKFYQNNKQYLPTGQQILSAGKATANFVEKSGVLEGDQEGDNKGVVTGNKAPPKKNIFDPLTSLFGSKKPK